MMLLEGILIFIVLVLVLVVSHESGHFFAAKWFGVKVEEFGVGLPLPVFPLRLFKKQYGETMYSWYLFPLGGFVRIFGEEEDEADPRSFSGKSVGIRSMIVAAGVVTNIIMAYIIFFFLSAYGTPQLGIAIEEVVSNTPASEAGFVAGDVIMGVGEKYPNQRPTMDMVLQYIDGHKGELATFYITRGSESRIIALVPRENPPEHQGPLGVKLGVREVGLERVAWYRVPIVALERIASGMYTLVYGLYIFIHGLFTHTGVAGEVLGPIGIASVAQASFQIGVRSFLELLAFLSLNLALVNILPIPALDGGRILFFAIERFKGSPIPAGISHVIHSIFFFLLVGLLLFVTYRDIVGIVAHPV